MVYSLLLMNIRSAVANDHPDVLSIYNVARAQAVGLPDNPASTEEFARLIEGEELHIAIDSGTTVAFVGVWTPDKFIHHLYVLPGYQSSGLGKALIQICIEQYGLPLRLKCSKYNVGAQSFYDNTGWIRESEAVNEDGPYINYLLPHHEETTHD